MPSPKQQPPIRFDEASHTYTDPDTGLIVPSVTTVLSATSGPSFYPDNGSRELGSSVHRMLERLDKSTLIRAFYTDPLHHAYLDHYESFLKDYHSIEYSGIEQRVYHKELRYAGTADRVGHHRHTHASLIADVKTGSTMVNANLQMAAYAMALFDDYEAVDRFVIQVHPQTLKGYRLYKYDDPMDFVKWRKKLEEYHANQF